MVHARLGKFQLASSMLKINRSSIHRAESELDGRTFLKTRDEYQEERRDRNARGGRGELEGMRMGESPHRQSYLCLLPTPVATPAEDVAVDTSENPQRTGYKLAQSRSRFPIRGAGGLFACIPSKKGCTNA